MDEILTDLESAGYAPVLRAMSRAATNAAGVDAALLSLTATLGNRSRIATSLTSGPIGDLIFGSGNAFVLQPSGQQLDVWEIRHHASPALIEGFCADVEKGTRHHIDGRKLRGMKSGWRLIGQSIKPSYARTRYYSSQPALKSRRPTYDSNELVQASLLVDLANRQFLRNLAKMRGKARPVDTDQINTASGLLAANLLQQEYLLLCRQDSRTICSFHEKEQLATEATRNMRCPLCNRAFSDELVQDIIALTEYGQKQLDGSRWMTTWITDLLRQSGIHESQISWNAMSGEDEIDIIVDLHGQKIFFELKDREFGLGDSYPFVARLEKYGGEFGVVISTEKIAGDAKSWLSNLGPNRGAVTVLTIEGTEQIPQQLPRQIDQISRVTAMRLLNEITEPFNTDLGPILNLWMQMTHSQRIKSVAA